MFWGLFIFRGNPTWEPESIVCNDEQGDLFCGPSQEPVLATASTGKTREKFWKNAGEWTGGIEISKEAIFGSRCSKHGCTLTCSKF